MDIEPQFKRLLTIEGFTQAFWEQCSNFKRHEDAYEFVEGQHREIFGERRYKNYESFVVCRNRYIKKLNEKD